jgi:hypothetical protein
MDLINSLKSHVNPTDDDGVCGIFLIIAAIIKAPPC